MPYQKMVHIIQHGCMSMIMFLIYQYVGATFMYFVHDSRVLRNHPLVFNVKNNFPFIKIETVRLNHDLLDGTRAHIFVTI